MVHCDDHYGQLEFPTSSYSIYILVYPGMLVYTTCQVCSKYFPTFEYVKIDLHIICNWRFLILCIVLYVSFFVYYVL